MSLLEPALLSDGAETCAQLEVPWITPESATTQSIENDRLRWELETKRKGFKRPAVRE